MTKPRKRPTKMALAEMKVLADMGHSPTAISKKMGKSHHTVIKYLAEQEIFNDPETQKLIEIIRESELNDLFLLGAKARKRLHDLLDEGDTKVIETTAVMDRSFQQRCLLTGRATQIIDTQGLSKEIRDLEDQIREYDHRTVETTITENHSDK